MSVLDGMKFWIGKQIGELVFTLAVLAVLFVGVVIYAAIATRRKP